MAGRTQEEILRLLFDVDGEEDIAATAKALLGLSKAADTSGAKARNLLDELQRLGNTTDGIQKFIRLKTEIAETGTKITETSSRLAAIRREIDASSAPNDKLSKSFDRVQRELDKLMRLQNQQSVELTKTGHTLRQAGVDTDKLGEAYGRLQGRLSNVTREATGLAAGVKRVGDEQGRAAGSANRMKKATDGAGESVAKLTARLAKVSAATAAASAALLAFGGGRLFGDAISSALEFEEAMSTVAAVSGATGDQLLALKAAAEAGGRATRFSSLEAAEGLAELARATGDADKAIAALPATLNLAQASTISVAEAASIITTTLTQFRLETTDAARVADGLAKAANSTDATISGLGNSLAYVAPLAKALGLSLEDTTAVVAALAKQGYQGERAGTALRNVMSALLDPTSKFSEALRSSGIESRNFIEILDQLADGSPRVKRALLALDAEARPAIYSLVNGGVPLLHDLQIALQNAGGEAERTAATMGANTGGALEALTDAYDRARRSFVEPLMEPLKVELAGLATELEAFAQSQDFVELREAFKELFVEGVEAARDFASEVDFKELAQSIRNFVNDSEANLAKFRESIDGIALAVGALGDTISIIFNALQVIVFGVAAAITGAIAVVVEAFNKLSGPQQKLLDFLGVSTEGFQHLEDFATGMTGVANDFAERTANNFIETGEAVHGFGDRVAEAAAQSEAAVTQVADANAAAAESAEALAGAATVAADALGAQAEAATIVAVETDEAARVSEEAAERIRTAFSDLGIKSREDLDQTAANAQRNFKLIADAARAGQRPLDDVRAAFVAYGQAALAAVENADAATQARVAGEVAVAASVNGVTDALVDLGLRSDDVGKRVADNAGRAVPPLQQLESAARGAAAATGDIGDSGSEAASGLRAMGREAGTTSLGLGALNQAALEAYAGVARLATVQPVFVDRLNAVSRAIRAQREAVAELSAGLDDQMKRFDPLAREVENLQRQYRFVDESVLRQVVEKRQRLKTELQRVADERRAARKERDDLRADVEAAEASAPAAARATGGDRSVEAGRVYVVRLVAGDNELDLQVSGSPDAFEQFMGEITRQRAVATGGRG